MTHRILAPQAPQMNRALIRRPLWLIMTLVALWLGVLLLAMQAYPQSNGSELPNPGHAHMFLAQPEDVRRMHDSDIRRRSPVLADLEKKGSIQIFGAMCDLATGVVDFAS